MASRIWLLPGWRRLALLATPPVLAVGVLAAVLIFPPSPQAPAARVPPAPNHAAGTAPDPGGANAADALASSGGLLVSVTGAVAHPGLYRVAKGERAFAAIAAAGGLTSDADPNRLPNLAARLKDGQEVKVPAKQAPGRGGSTRASRVSLNSATAAELAAVPGFTPDLAAAAVRYRQDFGGFSSTRELVTGLGMGQADYQLARSHLTL
jgi:competence protein ComEA